ncbi:MAG: iron-sulfur cluster insertion protein ErpA [Rhizobiales bacterium]|nr:iron-sulfur cluster insertion protein ErpA [Hyphomicrobiales bacterium]
MSNEAGIVVTASAAERIATILKKEADGTMLRISVSGGGCSGFQYNYDLVTESSDDDLATEKDGITVLVDSVSLMYMAGAEIDFADDLIGQAFQINNPNAVAGCGCGTSFSI